MTKRKILQTLIGMLAGMFLVGFVWQVTLSTVTLQAIRHQQVQNSPLLHDTHHAAKAAQRSLRIVESCTTTGQPCARRNARATAAAISTLSTKNAHTAAVTAAAGATCSLRFHGYQSIYMCIVNRLSFDSHHNHH